MARTVAPLYPAPDRSDQVRHFRKDEDGVIDIGWSDGAMSDGRPYIAEMWAQDQVSMLTLFFSSKGIEDSNGEQIRNLIVKEGLVAFRSGAQTYCDSTAFIDCAGNALWSVNIVVGDEDNTYLTASPSIRRYE